MVVVASHVGKEVHGPAEKLLSKGMNKGSDWSFLSQLIDLVDELSDAAGVMLSGLGDEHHVTLHVSSSLVVLAVGDLPREVWDKKCGVTNPSSGIVENLRWRERLVTALVRKNPETSAK